MKKIILGFSLATTLFLGAAFTSAPSTEQVDNTQESTVSSKTTETSTSDTLESESESTAPIQVATSETVETISYKLEESQAEQVSNEEIKEEIKQVVQPTYSEEVKQTQVIENELVKVTYEYVGNGYYRITITDKQNGSNVFPESETVDLQQGFKATSFINYIE